MHKPSVCLGAPSTASFSSTSSSSSFPAGGVKKLRRSFTPFHLSDLSLWGFNGAFVCLQRPLMNCINDFTGTLNLGSRSVKLLNSNWFCVSDISTCNCSITYHLKLIYIYIFFLKIQVLIKQWWLPPPGGETRAIRANFFFFVVYYISIIKKNTLNWIQWYVAWQYKEKMYNYITNPMYCHQITSSLHHPIKQQCASAEKGPFRKKGINSTVCYRLFYISSHRDASVLFSVIPCHLSDLPFEVKFRQPAYIRAVYMN